MKPERSFIAERVVAQHCPELLRAGPPPSDFGPTLSRLGEKLARTLSSSLAALSGGHAPAVRAGEPRDCTMHELAGEIAPLAANSLHTAGPQGATFLASLDAEAVLRLVDRAFGGRGDAPSPLPGAFPLSAELMIGRLDGMISQAAARALEMADDGAVRTLRRDGSLRQLAAFGPGQALTVIALEIEAEGQKPWTMTLAFPPETLTALFGHGERAASRSEPRLPPNPADEPFGDVPLTLSAVLVDMKMAFSALSVLEVGQILPVAVARSVPLKIDGKTIALGTIGALDDQVAVQITQAF